MAASAPNLATIPVHNARSELPSQFAMHPAHHHFIAAQVHELRPTQAAVGFCEVVHKQQEWRQLGAKERKKLINSHWFPAVLGPGQHYFIVDHHHLGLALHHEGAEQVNLTVLKDLSWLEIDVFWKLMEFHQWVHPYDEKGQRIGFHQIPKSISELKDDLYRGLAGEVRKLGGFAKDVTPYSEFLWADYYRTQLPIKTLQKDWDKAVQQAFELAKSVQARYLPGWCGTLI